MFCSGPEGDNNGLTQHKAKVMGETEAGSISWLSFQRTLIQILTLAYYLLGDLGQVNFQSLCSHRCNMTIIITHFVAFICEA